MENELVNVLSTQITIIAAVVSIAAVSICSILSAFITQRGARKAKQTELILQETISAYYELLKIGGEFSDVFNQQQATRLMAAYTKALLFASPGTAALIRSYEESIARISAIKLNPPPDFSKLLSEHEEITEKLVISMQKDLRK